MIAAKIDFARLDSYEIRVYQNLGGAELRAAIELVNPTNKDRAGNRLTFAAKCAGYLRHGIGVLIIDVVTARTANLHEALFDVLEVKSRRSAWQASTGLYAISYRAVTTRKSPRVEAWPETLTLGKALPSMPLWLALDLCVPVRLEESYLETCRSLRIPARCRILRHLIFLTLLHLAALASSSGPSARAGSTRPSGGTTR
jgi:hypothetical protein